MRAICLILGAAMALLVGGCASSPGVVLPASVRPFEIPRVAVLDFENKAPLAGQWDVGRGMRDQLVDELVKSRRYTVLERGDLPAVLAELRAQQADAFRQQGKVAKGRLKNAQYLIRGSVTDFAQVSGGGLGAFFAKLGIGAGASQAIVSITLYVIDVESGEVVASESLDGQASAGSASMEATYRNVSFGGHAFYRTPLGKATREVLNQAVARIGQAIGREPWHPQVISVDGQHVMITGGEDRVLQVGSVWEGVELGAPIVDPGTGDILGHQPGHTTGRLRLTVCHDRWSEAELLEGSLAPDERLRLVPLPPATTP